MTGEWMGLMLLGLVLIGTLTVLAELHGGKE